MTSEEEYVSLTKTPFTLHDYIPKDFFDSDSLDDEPTEEEVAQCYLVSWADECRGKPLNLQTPFKKWMMQLFGLVVNCNRLS